MYLCNFFFSFFCFEKTSFSGKRTFFVFLFEKKGVTFSKSASRVGQNEEIYLKCRSKHDKLDWKELLAFRVSGNKEGAQMFTFVAKVGFGAEIHINQLVQSRMFTFEKKERKISFDCIITNAINMENEVCFYL